MSRSFNGSNQYLRHNGSVGIAAPCSISCWIKTSSGAQTAGVITTLNTAVSEGFAILLIGGKAYAADRANAVSVASYATNRWVHIVGAFTNNSLRSVYLDNVKTTNSSSVAGVLPNANVDVGRYGNDSSYYTGLVAEVAFWNIALNETDVYQLYVGASPKKVKPSSLIQYWPLVDTNNQNSIKGTILTNNGSTNPLDHPRIYN